MASKVHTAICKKPLQLERATQFVSDPTHGALCSFAGQIRDHNLGKKVVGVSYDVFEPLAVTLMQQICRDAQQQTTEPLHLFVEHFKGKLAVNEASVVIATSSPHRDEAFQACRHIIEEIKHKVPIWKQEHYVDGNSEWVKGHALCAHNKRLA